jgi:hypothetical protein
VNLERSRSGYPLYRHSVTIFSSYGHPDGKYGESPLNIVMQPPPEHEKQGSKDKAYNHCRSQRRGNPAHDLRTRPRMQYLSRKAMRWSSLRNSGQSEKKNITVNIRLWLYWKRYDEQIMFFSLLPPAFQYNLFHFGCQFLMDSSLASVPSLPCVPCTF